MNKLRDIEQLTFCEQLAELRWGKYLTIIERSMLDRALRRFDKPGHAMEIGCEGGRWCQVLDRLGWEITCSDIAADTLAICQERLPGANCILTDVDDQQLHVDDETCDLFLSIGTPVPARPWFARELFRVLRAGGLALLTLRNRRSYRGILVNYRHPSECYYETSYAADRKRLLEQGFRFIEQTGYAWMPFGRFSDSKLIPFFGQLERLLGLRRLVRWSPWIAAIVEKPPASARSAGAARSVTVEV